MVSKLHVPNGTAKAACLCIPCVQTLITVPLKHIRPMELLVSRFGYTRASSCPVAKFPPKAQVPTKDVIAAHVVIAQKAVAVVVDIVAKPQPQKEINNVADRKSTRLN